MIHPEDLKPLVWGRHLHRLLAACGKHPVFHEPAPRIVGRVPVWFQRLGAALTLLGLVGGIRMLDRAISKAPEAVQQADVAPVDAATWNTWAATLRVRFGPFDQEVTGGIATLDTTMVQDSTAKTPVAPSKAAAPTPAHRFQRIDVTAYTSRAEETDDTPQLAASGRPVETGTIALSRDLLRTFTPGAPFDFGDKVLIPGVGIFEVRDTMHPRWTEKADIWFASADRARSWGHRTVFVTHIGNNAPTIAYQAN